MNKSDNNADVHGHGTSAHSREEFVQQMKGKELSRNEIIKSPICQDEKIQIYPVKSDSEIPKII